MNVVETLRKSDVVDQECSVDAPGKPRRVWGRRDAIQKALLVKVNRQVENLFFSRYDRRNPLHCKAFQTHMEAHNRCLRLKRRSRRIYALEAPAVVRSVIEYRVLDASENVAILERKAALARLEESKKHILAELGVHQGCFLDDEEALDVDRLEVVKKNKVAEVGELKSLVNFCQELSSGSSQVPLEAVCNGEALPAQFRQRTDYKAFLSDLGLFLVNSGDNGRSIVRKVCEEHAFAERMAADDEQPRPVRFLASISLKVLAFANNRKQEQAIGFKAG